jgi:hypothetical protein
MDGNTGYYLVPGSLRSQLIGMMECWNIGMLGLEDWGSRVVGYWGNGVLTNNYMRCNYPLYTCGHAQAGIIPGRKKKNGWWGIPYYQRFLEIPLHKDIE